MSDGGLRHLEALHHKSGGLELPHGRRLKLDSGRSAASTQPKKLAGNTRGNFKAPLNNENMDNEGDDLPDPHEILQSVSKTRPRQVIDCLSDSDTSMASGFSNKKEPLNSILGRLEPEQSPIGKQVLSTSPVKSTRRSRAAAFPGPGSPSPAAKRQRFSTSQSKPGVTKVFAAERDPTTSHEQGFDATVTTEAIAQQVKLPLFLEDTPSSDRSDAYRGGYEYDENFTSYLDAFDVQPSTTMSTSSLEGRREAPGKRFDSPNINNLEGSSSLRFMDEDTIPVPDNVQIGGEVESSVEQDEYGKAVEEFWEWLYSGAVEITGRQPDA
ncbi:hypothetical protein JB92DRAFT_3124784 [Gautieria morchelliformis]|nr:hypothetical protein JB92DRAFT_3124784 [Gautieria morchelliformis]